MKYMELKNRFEKEYNDFSKENIIWAFSDEQLNEALKERGLTLKQFKELYSRFYAGGAILNSSVSDYEAMSNKHYDELHYNLRNDSDFAYEAFRYELANHEYCITCDETPALRALCLTVDDIKESPLMLEAFKKAEKECRYERE